MRAKTFRFRDFFRNPQVMSSSLQSGKSSRTEPDAAVPAMTQAQTGAYDIHPVSGIVPSRSLWGSVRELCPEFGGHGIIRGIGSIGLGLVVRRPPL